MRTVGAQMMCRRDVCVMAQMMCRWRGNGRALLGFAVRQGAVGSGSIEQTHLPSEKDSWETACLSRRQSILEI